jgi:hypothetical protein
MSSENISQFFGWDFKTQRIPHECDNVPGISFQDLHQRYKNREDISVFSHLILNFSGGNDYLKKHEIIELHKYLETPESQYIKRVTINDISVGCYISSSLKLPTSVTRLYYCGNDLKYFPPQLTHLDIAISGDISQWCKSLPSSLIFLNLFVKHHCNDFEYCLDKINTHIKLPTNLKGLVIENNFDSSNSVSTLTLDGYNLPIDLLYLVVCKNTFKYVSCLEKLQSLIYYKQYSL